MTETKKKGKKTRNDINGLSRKKRGRNRKNYLECCGKGGPCSGGEKVGDCNIERTVLSSES